MRQPKVEDLADEVTAYAFMATRQESHVSRERADHPNRLLPLLVARVQERDVDGLVDLFEDEAVLDTGNGVARGSAAIREFWEGFVASRTTVTVGQQAEALINGELALTSTRMPDGVVTVEIARRQADGAWKWVIDQPNLPVTPD